VLSARTLPLLAGLAICLALDLRVALRGEPEPADEARMRAARALIEGERKSGDLLVHSPLLSVRELAVLGDLPIGPGLPSPELLSSRRILVLDDAATPMYGFEEIEKVEIEEGAGRDLVLRIVERKIDGEVALFDLASDLDRARMRIERGGRITSECSAPRSEGGKACPGEAEWLYLAPRTLAIAGQSGTCVWAHPTTGGTIVIELPAQPEPPAGRALRIEVSAGLADDAVRTTPDGAEVRTAIVQGGAMRAAVVVPNRIGWFRASSEIAPNQPIELQVTTDRDGRRHHCLNARITEEP